MNDINVLDMSDLPYKWATGPLGRFKYEIGEETFTGAYQLVDGIYPDSNLFVAGYTSILGSSSLISYCGARRHMLMSTIQNLLDLPDNYFRGSLQPDEKRLRGNVFVSPLRGSLFAFFLSLSCYSRFQRFRSSSKAVSDITRRLRALGCIRASPHMESDGRSPQPQ